MESSEELWSSRRKMNSVDRRGREEQQVSLLPMDDVWAGDGANWWLEICSGCESPPASVCICVFFIFVFFIYKDWICIPYNIPNRTKNLEALHYSPLRVHSGIPVTLRRIKQNFYWKGIRASVHQYVQECTVCQRAKPDRAKYPGQLAPLPVPSQYWMLPTWNSFSGLICCGNIR